MTRSVKATKKIIEVAMLQQLRQLGDVDGDAPRSKVQCIFVISVRHQRCYSDYSACGIQWRSGPNL